MDLATGTGNTAIEMAKKMPEAQITGIDISSRMLEKARVKNYSSNVELIQHDMESLETLSGQFDLVTCAFGVYFVDDVFDFFKSMH